MHLVLILSTMLHTLLYLLLYIYDLPLYYQSIAALLNLLMLLRILYGFGLMYTLNRLSRGEILPLFMYLLWLWIYPQEQHLFKLPILISCIGKTYLLLSNPQNLFIDAVENLIVLQSQTEFFIVIYHFAKSSILVYQTPLATIIQYSLLFTIIKVKFDIHYGTRKAFEDIHFCIDRCAKNMKFRGFYHFLQRMISKMGGNWSHTKMITY